MAVNRMLFSMPSLKAAMIPILVGVAIGLLAIQQMLINTAVLVATIFLASLATKKRWEKRNISFIFYGMFLLFFGITPLAAQIFKVELVYPIDVITKANLIVLVTLSSLYLGEELFLKIKGPSLRSSQTNLSYYRSWIHAPMTSKQLEVIMRITFVLSVVGFIYLIFGSDMHLSEMINMPRMELRLQIHGAGNLIAGYMFTFSMIAMYLALDKGRRKIIVLSLVVMCMTLVAVFGARYYVLYVVGPFLLYFITKRKTRSRAALSFGLLTVLLIVFIIGVLHVFRWESTRDLGTLINTIGERKTYEFIFLSPQSDLNLRNNLYKAVDIFPREHDWLYGNTYKTILLFWLPSSLSEGLKMDTMYLFAYAVTGSSAVFSERLSDHPTFVGDLYINFGYLFWIGAFMWGLLFGYIYRVTILYRNSVVHILMGSIWVYFIILVFRGSIYQPFMKLIASAVFLLLATWFVRLRLLQKKLGET